jgi:bacillopeptidase F (M6 metalloprotease family)
VFKYDGNQFINPFKDNKVLSVDGYKDEEGSKVIVDNNEGKAGQQWKVVYVDKSDKEATKGLNEDFGWYINRPFYIRSRMFFRRVVEAHGNNWLYLRRWVKNRTAQQWKFDIKDKTLHNEHWKNYVMTIHGNGSSNHMRMLSSITSRWW